MKIYTEKLRYSVDDLVVAFGVSRGTILNRWRAGQLKMVRDGKTLYASRDAVAEYMSKDQRGAKSRSGRNWYKALRAKEGRPAKRKRTLKTSAKEDRAET